MKVLMLAQSVDSYSSSGFVAHWVRALGKKVDTLIVLTYKYNPKEPLGENTKVYVVKGNNLISRNLNLFKQIFILVRKEKVDLIFSHILEVFGVAAGISGKVLGLPTFFWYCQTYDISKNKLALAALYLSSRVFTCGQRLKDKYIKEGGQWLTDKVIPVGHGLDLDHYQKGGEPKKIIPGKKTILLYAGRIAPIKDLMTLLSAIEILSRQNVDIELKISGGWGILNAEKLDYKNVIMAKIDKINKIKKIVLFVEGKGHSYEENYKIFKSAQIFIMPTLSVALDMVYLEALACGVPAIGTDIGYPFMVDKFPELVFRAGDCQDLARKIEWLIDNPKEAAKITRNARQFVFDNFDLEKLMVKITDKFVTV